MIFIILLQYFIPNMVKRDSSHKNHSVSKILCFFRQNILCVVWEAAFMTKQWKHGKTDVEKGKGTKTKKNADRFREITKQDFLSCSNYNNLSSFFLDFICWFSCERMLHRCFCCCFHCTSLWYEYELIRSSAIYARYLFIYLWV